MDTPTEEMGLLSLSAYPDDDPFAALAAEAVASNSGVRKKGRRTELSDAQVNEIRRLRASGVALHKIAKAYHIGPARVTSIVLSGIQDACNGSVASGSGSNPGNKVATSNSRVRMSSRFVAAEPSQPVAADMGQLLARKAKVAASEPEFDLDAELDRFEEALAAFRAGCDDSTMVGNLKELLETIKKHKGFSAREYRTLKRELNTPRHAPTPPEVHPDVGSGFPDQPDRAPHAERPPSPVRDRPQRKSPPRGGPQPPADRGDLQAEPVSSNPVAGPVAEPSAKSRPIDIPQPSVHPVLAQLRAKNRYRK